MLNRVEFTDEENKQIRNKISDSNYSSESWSDDDIANIKVKIKGHYLSEQKNTCPYCRQKIKSNHGRYWDIEHIIPRSSVPNFMFEPLNLCMSCVDCNSAKSDKKVTSSRAKQKYPKNCSCYLIIHPHFDEYYDNILVIKEGFYYVALKKKGEKTIEVCKLNRFYEFSEFGASVQDDDRIFLLSEQLKKVESEVLKKEIRRNIAELAIRGAV
ncbi:HNH endonuclease [Photobacterium chitinilyticum]|uniref:HNH endonuclease n=1 Tax=Photobacterium chitinilyticum TaxID=2485123 RepID=A0A444JVU4_9GAMM|nr:HNH endonuclease [Photobacterium chitinilyticum]RWX57204.1 HNH endonuclease [Photobacterium chitinilyticum]